MFTSAHMCIWLNQNLHHRWLLLILQSIVNTFRENYWWHFNFYKTCSEALVWIFFSNEAWFWMLLQYLQSAVLLMTELIFNFSCCNTIIHAPYVHPKQIKTEMGVELFCAGDLFWSQTLSLRCTIWLWWSDGAIHRTANKFWMRFATRLSALCPSLI